MFVCGGGASLCTPKSVLKFNCTHREGEGSVSGGEISEMREQLRDIQCTFRKPAFLLLELLVGKISVTIPNRDDL